MTPQEIIRIRNRLMAISILIREILSILEDNDNSKVHGGETGTVKRE